MDNLGNRGLREDEARRRGNRKKAGRKRFVVESRYRPGPDYRPSGLGFLFRHFEDWSVHSRYHTASARDEAHAALVKRARVSYMRHITRIEYRK